MLRQFAGAWLVWVERHRVRALYRSVLRPAAALTEEFAEEIDPATRGAWLQACESMFAKMHLRWPLTVTIALPQSMTPCFGVAFEGAKAQPSLIDAYLKARFEQVHGRSSEGWSIRCDTRVRNGKALAFACEDSTIRELQTLRARIGRLAIVPSACWGAQRALRLTRVASAGLSPSGFAGWYVHVEDDRQVAMWINGGRAAHIALLPALLADDMSLTGQLAQWEARLKLSAENTTVLIGESTARPLAHLAGAGRKMVRLGVFDAAQVSVPAGGEQPGGQAWA